MKLIFRKAEETIGAARTQPPAQKHQGVCCFAAAVMAVIVCAPAAMAAPAAYTDSATFSAAATGTETTVDFDSTSAGTPISSGGAIGGLSFSYSLDGVSLAVTDGTSFGAAPGVASTTSGSNFLGTDDLDHLQDGDTLTLSFAAGSGVGLYILAQDALEDDDVTLTAGGATASLVASAVEQTLADGSSVFFLGVLDTEGSITSAVLDFPSDGETNFLMNVDDVILVPEPGQLLLLLPGSASLAGLSRLRGRRSDCSKRGESAGSRKRSGDV